MFSTKRILENVVLPEDRIPSAIEELKNDLDNFSTDGTYTITTDEFIKRLKEEFDIEIEKDDFGGYNMKMENKDEEPLKERMRIEFDNNFNNLVSRYGNVDYPEYLQFVVENIVRNEENEAILKKTFYVFDRNNEGFITNPKDLIKSVNKKIKDADIEKIVKEADIDGDGKLNYPEFVYLMMSINE